MHIVFLACVDKNTAINYLCAQVRWRRKERLRENSHIFGFSRGSLRICFTCRENKKER